jgi:hypothetical protein
LIRQLRALPEVQRKHVAKAIRLNTEEGARVARTLAPNVTGQTRDSITAKISADGMRGEVVVIPSDAPRKNKDRAYSIEYGRKAGKRGQTVGYNYVWRTRQYLSKKFRGRIRRAVNKAAKEVAGRG